MCEILRNPGEEQHTTEPVENMEENRSEETNTQATSDNSKRDMLSTLETLGEEERSLLAEKSQLLNMEETLKQKIKDEIEIRRRHIENLKYEIPELKQRCEALAKALDIIVQK